MVFVFFLILFLIKTLWPHKFRHILFFPGHIEGGGGGKYMNQHFTSEKRPSTWISIKFIAQLVNIFSFERVCDIWVYFIVDCEEKERLPLACFTCFRVLRITRDLRRD